MLNFINEGCTFGGLRYNYIVNTSNKASDNYVKKQTSSQ